MIKNNYYIFRHGETFFTKHKVDYGRKRRVAKIINQAIPVIRKMGKYIKSIEPSVNIVSEYDRCVETALIISGVSGKVFQKDSRANEFFEETYDNFYKRVKSLVEELESESGNNYIICTHGYVMAAIKHFLLDGDFDKGEMRDYPEPGNVLLIHGDSSEVKNFNHKE